VVEGGKGVEKRGICSTYVIETRTTGCKHPRLSVGTSLSGETTGIAVSERYGHFNSVISAVITYTRRMFL
jgi:hypothetical protein